MTRELCSEGWVVDKVRIMSQIEPKYRKWTPGVTGTIDKDKCNRSVIDPYDYEPLMMCGSSHSSLPFRRCCPALWSIQQYTNTGKTKSWHETPWSIRYLINYSRVIVQINTVYVLWIPNAKVPSFRSFMTINHAALIYISFQKFAAALVSNIRTRSALHINNIAPKKFHEAISLYCRTIK